MNKIFFVSGIGTDVGKTVASAVLCKALKAAYWKPIQSGAKTDSDSNTLRNLCGEGLQIFPARYLLQEPLSPHTAARIDGEIIDTSHLALPNFHGNLIIEGAGGLMVPLNRKVLLSDWIQEQEFPVILVSRHYLGSLNHTMLSIELLQAKGIEITGVLFVGKDNDNNESLMCERFQVRNLGNLPEVSTVTPTYVDTYAGELLNLWKTLGYIDLHE
jgi:dethiobiotin synthetase